METAKPDLCILGTDPAGFGVAFAAAALGVPVCLVTGQPPNTAFKPALARLVALGARVIEAEASFTDPKTVSVAGLAIRARRFVIAAGARDAPVPVSGLEGWPVAQPEGKAKGLLVLGAGAKGVRDAHRAAKAGTPVLLVATAGFLPGFDGESTGILRAILEADGVKIREGVDLAAIAVAEEGGHFVASVAGGDPGFAFSHYIADLGDVPNLDRLNVEKAGVRLDGKRLVLSPSLRTSNPRIYAAGAVTLRPHARRHTALHARILLSEILFRRTAAIGALDEIRLVETEPALAEFGCIEADIEARYVARHRFRRVPVAGPRGGLLKAVTNRKGQISGVSLLSARAAETSAALALAARSGTALESLAELPVASPGEAEAIGALSRLAIAEKMRDPATRRLVRFLRLFG